MFSDIRCCGIVKTQTNPNFGNRCQLKALNNNIYCKYHQNQRNDTPLVIKVVKQYLRDVDFAIGINNKTKIIDELYMYLLENIGFINKNENFKNTVIKKLDDFIISNEWNKAQHVKDILLQKLEEYN